MGYQVKPTLDRNDNLLSVEQMTELMELVEDDTDNWIVCGEVMYQIWIGYGGRVLHEVMDGVADCTGYVSTWELALMLKKYVTTHVRLRVA